MANKAAIAVIAVVGVVAGIALFATRAKAAPAPPEEFTLTVADILASLTMGELEVNYTTMNTLYVTGKIDKAVYEELYQAYITRFYQLTGFEQ